MCIVTRDLCRKLNNKNVISFMQILFIMPVLKLSRRTVYNFINYIMLCTFTLNQIDTIYIYIYMYTYMHRFHILVIITGFIMTVLLTKLIFVV